MLARNKACVYVTGSFGRCEASAHSDLDLFIVGKRDGLRGPDGKEGSALKRLDEICIKADLIEATRALDFPEFSGDGRYLTHYSVHDFTKTLGTPHDDATNTLTARLLLLLESRPLLEHSIYDEVIEEVVAAYSRDYEDHKNDFIPAFLTNDILRLWRTFCVNYEARTERVPEKEKAKGKLKNYKLKHSRLLTCYSGILYLVAIYSRDQTVTPKQIVSMTGLTPTERLEWLLEEDHVTDAHGELRGLLDRYQEFLQTTNAGEQDLIERFSDKEEARALMQQAAEFGDFMFEALTRIGKGDKFHRLLVV
ncbi:MAG: hypothetical protein GC160_03815 [Acidobacteria bacterium]|nr:hypothetical protein [Acidobacteriota bacterium]